MFCYLIDHTAKEKYDLLTCEVKVFIMKVVVTFQFPENCRIT